MSVRMAGVTLQGVLLFLFIPLVLFLFLRQPAGPGWSVATGLVIMFGHRFVAAPWTAKFADVRCLWCGRVGAGRTVPVIAGGRQWQMTACSNAHADLIGRFLGFVFHYRIAIALGIGLPLSWLIVASLASAAGHPLLPHDTTALIFRVLVAATVVTASIVPFLRPFSILPPSPFRLRRGRAAAWPVGETARCPFPLHNLFLLGIGNTLWVFRGVGAWWLVDGVVRLLR
ncbi:MAG TPA: hypothetical protein VF332_09940 [Vicinamibacterales bacterium]